MTHTNIPQQRDSSAALIANAVPVVSAAILISTTISICEVDLPTYEYACNGCGRHFEVWQSFKDDALETCEECGGRLRRVFHPVGVLFKGSGFYSTDARTSKSAGKNGKPSDRSKGSGSSEGSSGEGKSSSSGEKTESRSGSSTGESGSGSRESGSKSSSGSSDPSS